MIIKGKDRQKLFIEWVNEHHIISADSINDDMLTKSLEKINVETSIYTIGNANIIRNIAVELVKRRDNIQGVTFHVYKNNINHLLAYAEYLDFSNKVKKRMLS